MRKNYFLFIALLISTLSFGQIVINEIDSDTPGTDAAEFIELKWTPNTSLDGYVVVLFNGSGNASYAAYDLDGKSTDANGFFMLGNTAVNPDITFADNFLQNGADAVAIYQASDTDFPTGTAATTTNLIDALVYDTDDADDTDLLSDLGETIQYNENENGNKDNESIQRKSDGTYEIKTPTFRAENDAAVCELSLGSTSATCNAFTSGTDTYTATVGFSGGGTSTYTVSASSGTVTGDDPNSIASGTITVTGVSEGTDVTITVTGGGGLCNLSSVITSPACTSFLTLPIYEGFDYTVGTNLIDYPNWENTSTSTDEVLIKAGSLAYPGLETSAGNSVSFDGVGSDPEILFGPISSGTVYASFIFKVTDISATSDFTDGGYFAIIGSDATGFDSRLWVRSNPDNSGTQFDIAIGNTGFDDVTSTLYNVNDEIFVVMSYDIATGNINAWINPDSNDFELANAPTATISTTDTSPSPSLNRFVIRQDSTGETPFIEMDEVRISTSWAEVTPKGSTASVRNDQIKGFNVFPNPASGGKIWINTQNNATKQVKVFDILGKQVLSKNLVGKELNVSVLSKGIYILKVIEEGKTSTRKLVVK